MIDKGSEKCEYNIVMKHVRQRVPKDNKSVAENSMCLPDVADETKASLGPAAAVLSPSRAIWSFQRVARCATNNNTQRALAGRTARRRTRKSRAFVSRALLKSRPTEKWKTKRIAPTNLQKTHRRRTSPIMVICHRILYVRVMMMV